MSTSHLGVELPNVNKYNKKSAFADLLFLTPKNTEKLSFFSFNSLATCCFLCSFFTRSLAFCRRFFSCRLLCCFATPCFFNGFALWSCFLPCGLFCHFLAGGFSHRLFTLRCNFPFFCWHIVFCYYSIEQLTTSTKNSLKNF